MSNYEGKLGEWLKYLQQQVEKKEEKQETPPVQAQAGQPVDVPEDVVVRERLGRVPAEDTTGIDATSIVGDFSLIEDRRPPVDRSPKLFDEEEIPNVEDYLPFLREQELPEPKASVEPAYPTLPEAPPEPSPSQGLMHLSEGTGEPKPVIKQQPVELPAPPVAHTEPAPQQTAGPVETAPTVAQAQPKPQTPRVRPAKAVAPTEATAPQDPGDLWNQLPKHIQILVGQHPKEVAQSSYKEFKETREQLIAKLLDPTISLEEAARILNVCPTTVRRYTNRGVLQHLRTAGNQRRFRLSDVLSFLESSTRGVRTAPDTEAEEALS